jgi:cyanophycinase-like exopeptidase
MTGKITLVGAGEMMAAMSAVHRAALQRLPGEPRPVFLDTTAGFETNVDAIAAKAVEYYSHHLQTELRVARFHHREKNDPSEVAAAVAEVRRANLLFAGPGSPTYAIKQWRDSPVWEAVVQQFEAGADLLFASAATITVGRYALPVYEIYKAGEDPFWAEGLDLLSRFGLCLAVIPHFDDASGGENYDTRFCYMGARRFDQLQECLPPEVAILGIDAYTAICFDPATNRATVSGQNGVTLIAGGDQQRVESGQTAPFEAFAASASGRSVVQTFDAEHVIAGYEQGDEERPEGGDPMLALTELLEGLPSLKHDERVEVLARLHVLRQQMSAAPAANEGPLVDLILELRQALRGAKRFDLADKARDVLDDMGFEVRDSAQGSEWTRR